MKLKILIAVGILASATIITAATNKAVPIAKALENTPKNTQAELYRFLKSTREAANEQGRAIVNEMSTSLINSLGETSKLPDNTEATEAFINSLAQATAVPDKLSKEQLIASIESSETQDGIPFVDKNAPEDQQVELTTALSVLTSALNNAAVSVEEITLEDNFSSKPPKNDIPNSAVVTPEDSEDMWTDADLSEIALCQATSPNVPDGTGNCNSKNRSYMRYTAVTSRSSAQYALLYGDSAYTDEKTGFRMVDGRYCIAVGSAYTTKIGTKINLVMADGSVIRCILGDCKADKDTDSTHSYCVHDGSVAEFIVDYSFFNRNTKRNPVNTALGIHCAIRKVVVIR